MMTVMVKDFAGSFAENKDSARKVREEVLRPALSDGEEVEIDFAGVDLATQSFVHALISDLIRTPELEALDKMVFAHCDSDVKTIISIVVEYSQDDAQLVDEDDEASE